MTIATPSLSHLGQRANLARARRAGNLERRGLVQRLRCECALAGCKETVHADAEAHRRNLDHFIIVPAHLDALVAANELGGAVVRAADRFFIVDARAV